ncbi:hypothetical protein F4779DRAFT_602972 [Xylariaceae sp. FL0662B]|nr:hypothetical protein F4779DRAFT_602972 [Xylariaceae sp. FL0662B]
MIFIFKTCHLVILRPSHCFQQIFIKHSYICNLLDTCYTFGTMRASDVFLGLSGFLLIGATYAAPAQHGWPEPDNHLVAKRWHGEMSPQQAQWIVCLAIQQNNRLTYEQARATCWRGFGSLAYTVDASYFLNYPHGGFPSDDDVRIAQSTMPVGSRKPGGGQ